MTTDLKGVRAEIGQPQIRGERVDKRLAADLIPLAGAPGAILLAPVNEQVDDSGHRLRGDRPFLWLVHHVLVSLEGQLTVAVWGAIALLARTVGESFGWGRNDNDLNLSVVYVPNKLRVFGGGGGGKTKSI